MKKFKIIFVTLIVFTAIVNAENINKGTAMKAALNFMELQEPDSVYTVKEVVAESSNDTALLYYIVFNEGGWVLLSGDDNTIPILGYSVNGHPSSPENRPPALQYLLNNYKAQVKQVKQKGP